MTAEQKTQVVALWVDGLGYKKIAAITGLSRSTIRSHLKRHGYLNFIRKEPEIPNTKPAKKKGTLPCRHCGWPVPQTSGRKAKVFCSYKCRVTWFNGERSRKRQNKQQCALPPYTMEE